MKKAAKPASTAPVMPSMKKTAALVAHAIGESLWPKQTGHARATRGTAAKASVISVERTLQIPCLPLKCDRVHRKRRCAHERHRPGAKVGEVVAGTILPHGPRGEKCRQHDRQRDEQQVKCSERHDAIPPVSRDCRSRGC